ncbi:FAD-binding oxidoreductase [Halosquirtibacter xylanolyticus]|uniref:FAD-binding and (Fe-S)-binding domain-containing protein n=1 Tax=Halosquirtibacter xylanolyticus TaxID=3374599 RepID=UPI0037494A41|nr:FAD-binding oxidoreductase [Prolixibacteraceae bacterium]
MERNFDSFYQEVKGYVDTSRLYVDELRRLTYGTDAGFYRLNPQIVVRSNSEEEVQQVLLSASKYGMPVTFRAAGTSLAGQSITDSVLIIAGKNWEKYTIHGQGELISVQPGLTGARVNQLLKPYGRKLGPDPASINSAMIGGIVMNNASGMNCGTHENSYQTIHSARIIFADGTLLDTSKDESREAFMVSHKVFIDKVIQLRDRVQNNKELKQRIIKKYSIKNTTGLSINPFVDFTDPFDIILHLMVGSEGTLGFLSEITLKTIKEPNCKSTSMMYFTDIRTACEAVVEMKKEPVFSAEMLDRVALKSVENEKGIPPFIKNFGPDVTAILIETFGDSPKEIGENIRKIISVTDRYSMVKPVEFTSDPELYQQYWNIRKGVFPAVGGLRETGSTCIIEDVAFHIEDLPAATKELQELISRFGYKDGVIYGHALEGNFHFIINQNFNKPEELDIYQKFMHEVDKLVVDKYDGSLKAEHGTGRNMAPFVKHEWGEAAYQLMVDVKDLFDPNCLLNPGVIINADPNCYIKNFKHLTPVHPIVDKCIECGFCEINCLTAGFSLSARQRTVTMREITRLIDTNQDPARQHVLEQDFQYYGMDTCAGDGLCATSCPVKIDTGKFIKVLRAKQVVDPKLQKQSQWVADHFYTVGTLIRGGLKMVNGVHYVMGASLLGGIASTFRKISGNKLPQWTPWMPTGVSGPKPLSVNPNNPLKVVYFPSCIAQTMGAAKRDKDRRPLHIVTQELLMKAGYEVIYPENMSSLCCGTPWESKGFEEHANQKSSELEAALFKASNRGEYPILCDTSPCLYRMRKVMEPKLKLYEPVEFIDTFLMDKLQFEKVDEVVTIHSTCSTTKMGLTGTLQRVAEACACKVVLPDEVGCCGFAGDRGFNFPEVNAYALRKLRPVVEKEKAIAGYSNSRTCEIGLSENSGIPYASIIYLVDRVTSSK